MEVKNQFHLIKDSLDFKINIEPKKLDNSIAPDSELTSESTDPYNRETTYQGYQNYGKCSDINEFGHADEIKQQVLYDSSSSEYDLREAAHPIICILTILFKICAMLTYLLPNSIDYDKVTLFIVVLLLVSFDFWITKNISGRLLVGLRWQNTFQTDGTESWSFQSHDCAEASNRVDRAFFWTSLMGSMIFWMFMVIGDILTLNLFQITLSFLCFLLSSINTFGFYKCRGEHQKKMQDFQRELTKKGLNVVGMVMLNPGRFFR